MVVKNNFFTSLLFITTLSPAFTNSAQATQLYYEGFDYPAVSNGTALTGLNSGTGWGAGWVTPSAGNFDAYVSPGLSYSTVPVVGGMAQNTVNTGTQTRLLAAAYGTVTFTDPVTPTDYWFSTIIQKVNNANAGDYRYLALADSASNHILFETGFGFQISGTSLTARVPITAAATSGSIATSSSITLNNLSVHLVVGKITMATGADSVTIWLDPALNVTPTTGGVTATGTVPTTTTYSKALIRLGKSSTNGTQNLDEMRFGTSFLDVVSNVPVPEPASAVLLGLGGVMIAGVRTRRQ